MRLDKLVAIMAANPPRAARDDRHHRDLHHRGVIQMPSIQRDLARMDMILGVVEDDRGKAQALGALIRAQRRPHPAKIVTRGRRSIALIGHQSQPLVAGDQRRDRKQRRSVIGTTADVDAHIFALSGCERTAEHRGQDAMLVPRGNEDGDGTGDRRLAFPRQPYARRASLTTAHRE